MKNALIIGFVALDVAAIVLSLLLMVAGYPWWGAVALLAAAGLVVAAAWYWRNSPDGADFLTPGSSPREWLVWDEELPDEPSDVEQQMEQADPVDAHAIPAIALTQPRRGRHRLDGR